MWRNWTPPQTATAKLQDNFTGTVREVVSGDCLVVADSGVCKSLMWGLVAETQTEGCAPAALYASCQCSLNWSRSTQVALRRAFGQGLAPVIYLCWTYNLHRKHVCWSPRSGTSPGWEVYKQGLPFLFPRSHESAP